MLKLFSKIATEANDSFEDEEDEIWVRNDEGQLVKLGDKEDESNKEREQGDRS